MLVKVVTDVQTTPVFSLDQHLNRHCQTIWIGTVRPASERPQAANRRHSARAAGEMAFVVEVVVDRGVDDGEFLQGLYVPEFGHCAFSSPERLVRVFRPLVEPATAGLSGRIADHLQRRQI